MDLQSDTLIGLLLVGLFATAAVGLYLHQRDLQHDDRFSSKAMMRPNVELPLPIAQDVGESRRCSGAEMQLQRRLIDIGTWIELDILYLMAASDKPSAYLSLIDPSKFHLTPVGEPIFNTHRGSGGDGVSSGLNTKWSPAKNGKRWSKEAASIIWGVDDDRPLGSPDLGTTSGKGAFRSVLFTPRDDKDCAVLRLNSTVNTQAPNNSAQGIYLANRSGDRLALWKVSPTDDPRLLCEATSLPVEPSPVTIQLFRSVTTNNWSSRKDAFCFAAGGDLTGKEVSTLTALRDWALNVGALSKGRT